jgi:choline dehydrogenase-like flavoprotein
MATLQEIIANAQIADTTEFTDASGVKFSVADLRSLSKMAEGEKQTAAQKRQEAERLASQAATLLASLQEQAEKATQKKEPVPGEDWRKDPFYQPVASELDKFNAVVEKLNTTIAAQQKALDNAQAIYALERMRSQYNAAPENIRKSMKFEDLAKQAVSEKHVDNYNLPTLEKIIEKATEPDRMNAFAAQKIEEAKKEWQKEQAVAQNAKPGSQARFRTQKSEKPPIAKIEDLNSEVVMNDPDVRAAFEGTVQ